MGVIKGYIQSDGVPYFVNETKKMINLDTLRTTFLPQIVAWINKANLALNQNIYDDNAKSNIFTSKVYKWQGGKRVDTGDRQWSKSVTLSETKEDVQSEKGLFFNQWGAINKHISQNHANLNTQNVLIFDSLLKEGYRILTKFGEFVRGDNVNYQVVVHTKGWEQVYEYMLDLNKFLSFAATAGNDGAFSLSVSTDKLLNLGILEHTRQGPGFNKPQSRQWSADEIANFKLFMSQARGTVELHGKKRKYPFSKRKVNEGQLLEAYLNSGFRTHYLPSGDASSWKNLKNFAKALFASSGGKDIIKDTLSDPSPFWQGGEGGPFLKNTQVKGNNASITNIYTLMRQMSRIYSILNNIRPEKMEQAISQGIDSSVTITDEEALEAIINMFEREGTSSSSITLYI